MIVNRLHLSRILGCQPTSIGKMVERGLPFTDRPVGKRGEWAFDTRAVIEWLVGGSYLQERGENGPHGASLSDLRREKEQEDIAYRRAQRRLRELDVVKQEGNIITLTDMQALFEEQHAVVRSQLVAIPGRLAQTLAPEMPASDVQTIIEREIMAALEAIASPPALPAPATEDA